MSLKDYSHEQIQNMSMIELASKILFDEKKALSFNELFNRIAELKELSEQEKEDLIAQIYTDLNVDGRFTTLGSNMWGLRRWYPVEQAEEEVHVPKKKKKATKKKRAAEELDDIEELDEDVHLDEELEDDEFDDFDDDDEIEEFDEDLDEEIDDDLDKDLDEDLDEDLDDELDEDFDEEFEDEEFEEENDEDPDDENR
ncbi:DNA-directed RNA polymerase subunit delta [Oceanobacillus piezotolerans]|uniref:Probable DNA-directed RNA polymerase subunit delta n=1 Tax=Oceanobacillus piezotolerans TaxID=2448030 RepID=A0A498DFT7_9BACI|nr:DNA-directed RNA polymerase subunit delta [Oceanobacillus piezotolerans]RLL42868.1 DNA-directed RNA polymerase subunit delta [Oceanobacillus piezotolerans]